MSLPASHYKDILLNYEYIFSGHPYSLCGESNKTTTKKGQGFGDMSPKSFLTPSLI